MDFSIASAEVCDGLGPTCFSSRISPLLNKLFGWQTTQRKQWEFSLPNVNVVVKFVKEGSLQLNNSAR